MVSRITTLSQDRFLQGYKFDGGEESDLIVGVIKRRPSDPTDARLVMHCFRTYMNDCLYRETSASAQAHLQAQYYDSQAARPTFDQLHWVPLEQAKELDQVPRLATTLSIYYRHHHHHHRRCYHRFHQHAGCNVPMDQSTDVIT